MFYEIFSKFEITMVSLSLSTPPLSLTRSLSLSLWGNRLKREPLKFSSIRIPDFIFIILFDACCISKTILKSIPFESFLF